MKPLEKYAPIGIVRSCFREKFGVPRQALMVRAATGKIKLYPDARFFAGLRGLESFSHIWIVYEFHKNVEKGWHPTIDTPRVEAWGGVGVFASRSPHRPNPIGLSAVKLERIDLDAEEGIEIHVSGIDILDGSPVLDIKPYLPYADRIETANSGWANTEIPRYPVSFSEESKSFLEAKLARNHPQLAVLIEQMLEWDPRPTSQRRAHPMESGPSQGKQFAFRVLDVDVQWEVRNSAPYVTQIIPLEG